VSLSYACTPYFSLSECTFSSYLKSHHDQVSFTSPLSIGKTLVLYKYSLSIAPPPGIYSPVNEPEEELGMTGAALGMLDEVLGILDEALRILADVGAA